MPMRRKILEAKVNILELPNMAAELDVPLKMKDFKEALKNISKSVSKENLEEYDKWMKEFGAV